MKKRKGGKHHKRAEQAVRHGNYNRGADRPGAKLTEDDVIYIFRNPDGLTQRALATMKKVSTANISHIRNRNRWRHITCSL